jgi:hypothetical protein
MDSLLPWLPAIIALFVSGGTWGMLHAEHKRMRQDVDELRTSAANQIRLEEQLKAVERNLQEHTTLLRQVHETVIAIAAKEK